MIVSLIRYRYTEQRAVLSSIQGSLPYEVLSISYVNHSFECNGPHSNICERPGCVHKPNMYTSVAVYELPH